MKLPADIVQFLRDLEAREGLPAARAWVIAHARELPADVKEELIFLYSVSALLEDTDGERAYQRALEKGVDALERLAVLTEKAQEELKKRDA